MFKVVDKHECAVRNLWDFKGALCDIVWACRAVYEISILWNVFYWEVQCLYLLLLYDNNHKSINEMDSGLTYCNGNQSKTLT